MAAAHDPIPLFITNDALDALRHEYAAATGAAALMPGIALAWHLRQRDCAAALALADALEPQLEDGPTLSDAARSSARGRLLLVRAEVHLLNSRHDACHMLLERAFALFAKAADPAGSGDCHWLHASWWVDRGQSDQVAACLDQALTQYALTEDTLRQQAAQARKLSNASFRAPLATLDELRTVFGSGSDFPDPVLTWIATARANAAGLSDDLAGSMRSDLECYHAGLNSGQVRQALVSAANAAETFASMGDLTSALDWSERALNLARSTGWAASIGFCLMQIGDLMRVLRRPDEARGYLQEALERMASQPGSRNYELALAHLGQLHIDVGDFDAGLETFARLEHQLLQHNEPDLLIRAWRGQASALFHLGRAPEANAKARDALALARRQSNAEAQIQALRVLATGAAGTPAEALGFIEEALRIAASLDGYGASPELYDQLAASQAQCGDFEHAYASKIAADRAREAQQWAGAQQRALALQVSQDVAQARADAAHHRALASNLREMVGTLETLGTIGREITASLDAQQVFTALYRNVNNLLDATAFAVYLLQADGKTLETAFGIEAGVPLPIRHIPLDHPTSSFAACARERQEILRSIAPGEITPNHIPGTLPTLSLLYAPLIVGDRLLGVMTIQSPRQHAYGERERSIFRALCAYGAVGLSNAAAYAAAEQAQRKADAALAELGALNNQLEARIAERTEAISAAMTSLAEHKRKLQAIVDTALDAVVRIDAQGIIIGWNAQAESLFGWPANEALGANLGDRIVPHAHREAHREGMQRYITSGVSRVVDRRIEITALHRSGREFPIELAITRVALEDIHAYEFCAFIRDITQRKQAEDEVRASLEKQRELNQLKARFITMASHEFRTPLATILSSTELLEHYIDRLPASDRADLFRSIGQAVRRMTSMLEDILIIGRDEAERAEFNPQPTLLTPFLERLVEEVRTATHDSYGSRNAVHLNLHDLPDRADVDEKLLRHIFGNLLSNAIKYSPDNSPVEFTARGADAGIEITVRDQGIGIPSADLPRLFESFHRAQNVGNIPGTGLGLAIVKRSVLLHGGNIEVDSAPGTGTCFTVRLPL